MHIAKRQFRSVLAIYLAFGASLGLANVAVAGSNSEVGLCTPRLISERIKESVLAMKAAQYCKGMPYTIDQAARHVEGMRCSPQASAIVDNMMTQYDLEYKTILKGDAGLVACHQAALIKLD